ncbi:MAG: response regulator [Acidobacteria bacterium]|nr:response regulator [Acidobacteriota bacterium]
METRDYFRIEANELIARLTADLRALPAADAEQAEKLWREMGRAAHTLKGAAHVVRETEIARLSHVLEDALAARQTAEASRLVDELATRIEGPVQQATPQASEQQTTSPISAPSAKAEPAPETLRVEVSATDALLSALSECTVLLTSMRGTMDDVARQRESIHEATRQLRAGARALVEETLDRAAMQSRRLQAESGDCWTRLRRQITEVERIAHALRLAPAHEMLLRVERTARRAAEEMGLAMESVVSGGDERVDIHLLANAEEALSHMARNAVVHGLRQKQTGGRIEIGLRREGSHLRFFVRDNGTGIDVEHLRAEAVARRWMEPEDAKKASRAYLLDMLARPGVTTQAAAGTLAGRGIGLDVARARARRVGGDVLIESQPGEGTTVTLRVPESLLALKCIVLEIAGHPFAVPLAAVEQTKQIAGHRTGMLPATEPSPDTNVLDCGPLLGLPRYGEGKIALEVKSPAGRVGLGVDRIVRVEDLVIEPTPERWQTANWIMGTYVDEEGRARLVLDPMRLRHDAIANSRTTPMEETPTLPVLVIDDSLTSRTLIANILTSAGYEADTAINAEVGLEKARARQYGVFFVDVEMPGMDGFEFLRRTRGEMQLQHVPVVMITSRNLPGDRERGLSLGASEYIVKSDFDQNKLLTTAAELLRGTQRAGRQQ